MTWSSDINTNARDAFGFFGGFSTVFKGLKMVYVDHRDLAKYYVPPMLLSVLFILGSWILFWYLADDVVKWLWAEPGTEKWWGVLHMAWKALSVVLWVTMAVITAVCSVFIFSLFAAPFADFISESLEGKLGTFEAKPFSVHFMLKDIVTTISFELIRFGIKAMWLVPLFVLSFIVPVVGHFVYVFFGGYFLTKYTGMDYIDWCAARRGWTWKERLAFARKHRFALAGFGSAVALSFMVPLLFVVVWPGAVAGGTLLFLRLTGSHPKNGVDSNLLEGEIES